MIKIIVSIFVGGFLLYIFFGIAGCILDYIGRRRYEKEMEYDRNKGKVINSVRKGRK